MLNCVAWIKFLFKTIQSKFLKNLFQNFSRISFIFFPEISLIFSWNFLYFYRKYTEILLNYWRKIWKKWRKNYEIPKKEISERLRKLLRNFTLNFWKVCRKSMKFQKKFEDRLNVQGDQKKMPIFLFLITLKLKHVRNRNKIY